MILYEVYVDNLKMISYELQMKYFLISPIILCICINEAVNRIIIKLR